MARNYSFNGPNASGSATKTMAALISSTTVRPRIFEWILGSAASPSAQAALYQISRFTAVGTAGSNPTPNPVDPADVACISTAGISHSGEPTYTAGVDLVTIPLNMQASYRWVASPGCELVAPATANNGLGARLVNATTSLVEYSNIFFFE